MLPILTLVAVAVGLVCGRLYSFVAVLLTGPFLALVGCAAALDRGWSLGLALMTGVCTIGLSQLAYLAGVRLRLDHDLRRQGGALFPRVQTPGKREDPVPTQNRSG